MWRAPQLLLQLTYINRFSCPPTSFKARTTITT
jgi:hypothetical protein